MYLNHIPRNEIIEKGWSSFLELWCCFCKRPTEFPSSDLRYVKCYCSKLLLQDSGHACSLYKRDLTIGIIAPRAASTFVFGWQMWGTDCYLNHTNLNCDCVINYGRSVDAADTFIICLQCPDTHHPVYAVWKQAPWKFAGPCLQQKGSAVLCLARLQWVNLLWSILIMPRSFGMFAKCLYWMSEISLRTCRKQDMIQSAGHSECTVLRLQSVAAVNLSDMRQWSGMLDSG